MPRLIVTLDGVTVRDVPVTRDRTTIGRRPYNDVVIDNLAVSGEHAAVVRRPEGLFVEDLGSTNGTLLNGRRIQRASLKHQDTIDIGKYRLRFLDDAPVAKFERTMIVRPGSAGSPAPVPAPASLPFEASAADAAPPAPARVRMVNGAAAGRDLALTKVVTTVGRPGVAVAAITRRAGTYTLSHLEGSSATRLNGAPLGDQPAVLHSGDRLELGGVEMEFLQA